VSNAVDISKIELVVNKRRVAGTVFAAMRIISLGLIGPILQPIIMVCPLDYWACYL
jgi:hypothetical protein